MTLNANKPTDQELVSALPAYIRASRAAINAMTVLAGFLTTNLEIAYGDTSLTIGVELAAIQHEIVLITGTGVPALANIYGGTEGQLKIFVFRSSVITIADGTKSGGRFYLNQMPALSIFHPAQDDVLVLMNIDGDGVAIDGYWKEIYRSISVK